MDPQLLLEVRHARLEVFAIERREEGSGVETRLDLLDAARSLIENGLPPPPADLERVPLVGAQLADAWKNAGEELPGLLEEYKRSVFGFGAWTLLETWLRASPAPEG